VALGYVNGDNHIDAVFAGGQTVASSSGDTIPNAVCLGNGDGGFSCSGFDGGKTTGVVLGDVDGDGHLDAVFSNAPVCGTPPRFCSGGQNAVCLGDGSGGFSCSNVNSDTNFTSDVALGFINGDADLDAVFSNWGNAKPNRVCLGNGSGVFSCSDIIGEIGSSRQVALGLLDGDVNIDAVFANFGSPR